MADLEIDNQYDFFKNVRLDENGAMLVASEGGGSGTHGFFDYNDVGTTTTPISLTGGGGSVYLTNDELGTFTNKSYPPSGVTDVWNASLNEFDFNQLPLGTKVEYRADVTVTITGTNALIELLLDLGIGNSTYTLNVGRQYFKTAGTYQIVVNNFIYIGDTNTLTGAGKFKMNSTNNTNVVVNGWACYITKY